MLALLSLMREEPTPTQVVLVPVGGGQAQQQTECLVFTSYCTGLELTGYGNGSTMVFTMVVFWWYSSQPTQSN
eukprot:1143087-Amphidinium_carterae.1